ncbi:hypothetical protein AGMMS50293_01110 [Spirochaetia bacterium]|nr:hypothetical protein AGMMS50293_01110 [Spirochaetia bacterium]
MTLLQTTHIKQTGKCAPPHIAFATGTFAVVAKNHYNAALSELRNQRNGEQQNKAQNDKALVGNLEKWEAARITLHAGEILLNNLLLGAGNEQAAKLAAAMSHEGTHAMGNRYEALAHAQGLSTYDTLVDLFNLSGDSGFRGSIVDALYDPASYVANTGNIDNWKLKINPDGTFELKDDNRSSLYLDIMDGSEFKLWDMESLNKWEAYNQIIAFGPQSLDSLSLSSETMKRLGLYSILNTNAKNLTEEQFGNVAENSYLNKDGLGYYIDFSSVLDYINQNMTGQYLSDARKSIFSSPDLEYSFNPALLSNLFTYGVMGSMGYTATVENDPLLAAQRDRIAYPEYHLEEDEYLSGLDRLRLDYNAQDIRFRNGQPPVTQLIGTLDILPQNDTVGTIGSGVISVLQSVDSVLKAKNIGTIHVNSWNVLGQSFFTMQTTVFNSMQGQNAKYEYKFITVSESLQKRYQSTLNKAAKQFAGTR